MKSGEIRALWGDFWEQRGHKQISPVSLVADSENKSVLFNVAGMQQLVPYLMGKDHPLGKRVYNIQPCIRTNDIQDIGDERHLTMFEMMGNRSLGDYFKHDALAWSIEFLTQVGIPLDKIGATIFAGGSGIERDTESYDILQKLGVQHIIELGFDQNGECDNFWTPGPVGPCGPCAEFYYDRGDQYGSADRDLGINDRYTEIRNNVFMSYHRDASSKLTQLSQKNVDTGMGFERLCMVLQDTPTIFETDIFQPIIDTIQQLTHTQYQSHVVSYRVILDHLRSSVALINDGVGISNEGRGYILRRLIRRAYYHLGLLCDLDEDIFAKLMIAFDTSSKNTSIIRKEIQRFVKTISIGKDMLNQKLQTNTLLEGTFVFELYDTYGFPAELTQEIAQARMIQIDREGYEIARERAKNLSRGAQNFQKNSDWSAYLGGLPETILLYDQFEMDTAKLLKEFEHDGYTVLIFDQTVFYPEMGGQIGDIGIVSLDDGRMVSICMTQKYAGVIMHFCK